MWQEPDATPNELLGEVPGSFRQWQSGIAPQPFPFAVRLGGRECVDKGGGLNWVGEWETTEIGGAAVSVAGDTVRVDFEDSLNCGGSNDARQLGSALRVILLDVARTLALELTGRAERQNAGYDLGVVLVDGLPVLQRGGEGDLAGCAMYDASGAVNVPLSPGRHTVELRADTVDNLYHVGAFWELSAVLTPALPADLRQWYFGFDARCFRKPNFPDPFPARLPNITDRSEMATIAAILTTQYLDAGQAALDLLTYLRGGSILGNYPNDASTNPGVIIAESETCVFVVVSGTSNFQQLAAQAAYSPYGPVSVGQYSTHIQWLTGAGTTAARISASGCSTTKPMFFAGHSYGAVVAYLLAVEFQHFGTPNRQLSVFTIGMPRPGDERLQNLKGPLREVHVANIGDGIPFLPPTGVELRCLFVSFTAQIPGWAQWVRVRSQFVLDSAGTMVPNNLGQISDPDLIDTMTLIVGNVLLPPFAAHNAGTYALRLALTPP